ncbi:MAG: hypothetical protein R3B09_32335 [Nannocystaceae bacterium]
MLTHPFTVAVLSDDALTPASRVLIVLALSFPFATQRELADLGGFSPNTVRESLNSAIREGWIIRGDFPGWQPGARALANSEGAPSKIARLYPKSAGATTPGPAIFEAIAPSGIPSKPGAIASNSGAIEPVSGGISPKTGGRSPVQALSKQGRHAAFEALVRERLAPLWPDRVPARILKDASTWASEGGTVDDDHVEPDAVIRRTRGELVVLDLLERYSRAVPRLEGTKRDQRRWLTPLLLASPHSRKVVRDVAEAYGAPPRVEKAIEAVPREPPPPPAPFELAAVLESLAGEGCQFALERLPSTVEPAPPAPSAPPAASSPPAAASARPASASATSIEDPATRAAFDRLVALRRRAAAEGREVSAEDLEDLAEDDRRAGRG